MEIYEKCNTCTDPTKRPVGFWDGEDDTHGCLYDCSNDACEVCKRNKQKDREAEQRRLTVHSENTKNGIDIKHLADLRKEQKISMRKMAEIAGCGAAEYSAYEHERKVFPTEIYQKCMDCITQAGRDNDEKTSPRKLPS